MLTKNDLDQIRYVVREEIREEVREEFQTLHKEIKMVDMKVELVNTKVDKLREDTTDGFACVVESIEKNDDEYKKDIRKIKDFVGMTS